MIKEFCFNFPFWSSENSSPAATKSFSARVNLRTRPSAIGLHRGRVPTRICRSELRHEVAIEIPEDISKPKVSLGRRLLRAVFSLNHWQTKLTVLVLLGLSVPSILYYGEALWKTVTGDGHQIVPLSHAAACRRFAASDNSCCYYIYQLSCLGLSNIELAPICAPFFYNGTFAKTCF